MKNKMPLWKKPKNLLKNKKNKKNKKNPNYRKLSV